MGIKCPLCGQGEVTNRYLSGKEMRDMVHRLRHQGLTWRQIAESMNRSVSTVWEIGKGE